MAQTTHEYVMQELGKTELSLRDVAEKAGVPYSTLTRIKRGGNASVHAFDNLATFFRSRHHRKAS